MKNPQPFVVFNIIIVLLITINALINIHHVHYNLEIAITVNGYIKEDVVT